MATDSDEYGDFPLRRYLGMEMAEPGPGVGVATVQLADQHRNPNGVTHGAVLFAMVDTAMGQATMSVLDEGWSAPRSTCSCDSSGP